MLTLGAIVFQNALALWALLLLPVIWWLLRMTPPRPERISFPPIRLLLGLIAREETPHKTPWWLIVLRVLLVACIILAIARPVIQEGPAATHGEGPLLVVLDDGWAAAKGWPERMAALSGALDAAERADQPVMLATTTARRNPALIEPKAAADARTRASALVPRALEPERLALADRLDPALGSLDALDVLWLADGLDYGDGQAFAERLADLAGGNAAVRAVVTPPGRTGLMIGHPSAEEGGLSLPLARAGSGAAETRTVTALAINGRSLAETTATFPPGETTVRADIALPLALRNEIARMEIAGERTAGAVYLLDDRWRRKTVGLASGGSLEREQPLLAPLYYVRRALEPYAELKTARPDGASSGIAGLVQSGLSMLVLADIGQLAPADLEAVANWISKGGVLVRFAGPRLAGGHDDLVPVELRRGGRALGGALTWEEPQPVAPFDEASPFSGLELSDRISVKRQVLAEPNAELSRKVWARLADGTPLVTAEQNGEGLVILFHVTANADWSNLPLSGLFVEMLRRILDRAQGAGAQGLTDPPGTPASAAAQADGAAFTPIRALNGYGEMVDPPADAQPIPANALAEARPSPRHPAGLYRRAGVTRAINLAPPEPALAPLSGLADGIMVTGYAPARILSLIGPLLIAALILFLIDALAVQAMSGTLRQLRSRAARTASAGLVAALALGLLPHPLHAQDQAAPDAQALSDADRFALMATLQTRLAYVETGDRQVDTVSRSGLTGLTDALIERTAVEPAAPVGIDIERDEIVFFPLLYWPVTPDAPALSPEARAKVDTYLKNGGTILFDTRDHQMDIPGLSAETNANTGALQRILSGLDIPPLREVPPDHVLTKAFYLLQSFPGRWDGGPLWVEAGDGGAGGGNRDGVSSIIIGSNDYAGAWATDTLGAPMFPAVPGGARQRELAYRTGINVVMYTLTGNYKADQVHVPALLERLGQ